MIAVCNTLNHVPSKLVNRTPYELWKDNSPNLSYMKDWGHDAYLKRLKSDKFETKSDKYIFVRYSKETIEYKFYYHEESLRLTTYRLLRENVYSRRGQWE